MARGLALDNTRSGTRLSPEMHAILGVCQACGILEHEEKLAYRDGSVGMYRVEEIRAVEPEPVLVHRYAKYGLRANPKRLPTVLGMGPQFAYALGVPTVSVEVEGGVVYVRVPWQDVADVVVTYEQAWGIAPNPPVGTLLLGVDEQGQQLVLNLADPRNVHALVVGATGSGKSTLMQTMALSAQMIGGAQVALFDVSGGLYPLSGHPSTWRGGLFEDADACTLGLAALARRIHNRYPREAGQAGGLLYCFVDEVLELIRQRSAVVESLSSLAQAGRHAGIHLVLGAQNALAKDLGAATLRNMLVRLIGKVTDVTAAYSAAGRGQTQAQALAGAGDMIAVVGGVTTHFQAAMPNEALLRDRALRWPPRGPRVPVQPSIAYAQVGTGGKAVPTAVPTPVGDGTDGAGGGRSMEKPDSRVVEWARQYIKDNKEVPGLNEIDRYVVELLGHGYTRRKQREVQALAARLEGLAI